MTQDTRDYIALVVKAGLVGTAVGVPVALAIREYVPEEGYGGIAKSTVTAVALTALALGVKEYYFHQDHAAGPGLPQGA